MSYTLTFDDDTMTDAQTIIIATAALSILLAGTPETERAIVRDNITVFTFSTEELRDSFYEAAIQDGITGVKSDEKS